MKNKYLMMIAKGKKRIEIHIFSRALKKIKPGDILLLFDGRANIVRAIVKAVRIYDSLESLLKSENFKEILPTAKSVEDLIKEVEKIYWMIDKNELHEKKFIAIELDVIDFIEGIKR